ncbi:MAG: isoprenylcysteine carboxylmethyltransferase family protein [Eubacteriales bacterium]|nr:isoprenylcysteine carboxylmethyltransferase family protein [Eubacteriales bacterium]
MVMKERNHLPMYGVGPIYAAVIIVLTVFGIALSVLHIIPVFKVTIITGLLRIIGAIFIMSGLYMWYMAVFKAKIDDGILDNHLVTTGVYAWVRNPIYSAFLMACTGALMIYGNLYLFVLPFVYWAFLTVLMKNTEEKWLKELYGKKYEVYCKCTNRCIPWKRGSGR